MTFATFAAVLAGIAITYGLVQLVALVHASYKGKPPKHKGLSEAKWQAKAKQVAEDGQREGFVAGYQLAIKVLENNFDPDYEKAMDRLRAVEDEVGAGWKSWGS